MNETFQCGDNVALVAYLYDECDPAARREIGTHVAICAACAAELAALGSTRQQLAAWAAPESDLGFRIMPAAHSSAMPADAWWKRSLPAWAQAAAACVLFGAGLWLGIARGAAPPEAPGGALDVAAPVASPDRVSAADLAAVESRLRAEIARVRTASALSPGAGPRAASDAAVLTSVRALIEESERRQQRELALRTAQVVRDFDTQRRADLAQIQRTFGQIEGQAGAEVRDQREMLNYLMRVSQQQR